MSCGQTGESKENTYLATRHGTKEVGTYLIPGKKCHGYIEILRGKLKGGGVISHQLKVLSPEFAAAK